MQCSHALIGSLLLRCEPWKIFLTLVLGAAVVALENKIGDLGAWLARTTGVEWFSTLGQSVTIVTGLIFIVCVLAFRRGIMGELIAWLQGRGKS